MYEEGIRALEGCWTTFAHIGGGGGVECTLLTRHEREDKGFCGFNFCNVIALKEWVAKKTKGHHILNFSPKALKLLFPFYFSFFFLGPLPLMQINGCKT